MARADRLLSPQKTREMVERLTTDASRRHRRQLLGSPDRSGRLGSPERSDRLGSPERRAWVPGGHKALSKDHVRKTATPPSASARPRGTPAGSPAGTPQSSRSRAARGTSTKARTPPSAWAAQTVRGPAAPASLSAHVSQKICYCAQWIAEHGPELEVEVRRRNGPESEWFFLHQSSRASVAAAYYRARLQFETEKRRLQEAGGGPAEVAGGVETAADRHAGLPQSPRANSSAVGSTQESIPEGPTPAAVDMVFEKADGSASSTEVQTVATSPPRSQTPERQPVVKAAAPDLTPRSSDAVAAILREVQEQEALLQWLRERAKEKGLDPAMAALAEKTVAHVQSLMSKLAQVDPRTASSGGASLTAPAHAETQEPSTADTAQVGPTRSGSSGLSLVSLRTGAVISPERSDRGGQTTPPRSDNSSKEEKNRGGSAQKAAERKAAEEKKVEQLFSTWEEKALAFEAAAMDVDATFDPSLHEAARAAAVKQRAAAQVAAAAVAAESVSTPEFQRPTLSHAAKIAQPGTKSTSKSAKRKSGKTPSKQSSSRLTAGLPVSQRNPFAPAPQRDPTRPFVDNRSNPQNSAPPRMRAPPTAKGPEMHQAAMSKVKILELQDLLDGGWHVDSLNKDRETPLHWAAAFGNLKAVQLLLDSGADPLRKDRWSRTASAQALEKGHYAVVDMLKDAVTASQEGGKPTGAKGAGAQPIGSAAQPELSNTADAQPSPTATNSVASDQLQALRGATSALERELEVLESSVTLAENEIEKSTMSSREVGLEMDIGSWLHLFGSTAVEYESHFRESKIDTLEDAVMLLETQDDLLYLVDDELAQLLWPAILRARSLDPISPVAASDGATEPQGSPLSSEAPTPKINSSWINEYDDDDSEGETNPNPEPEPEPEPERAREEEAAAQKAKDQQQQLAAAERAKEEALAAANAKAERQAAAAEAEAAAKATAEEEERAAAAAAAAAKEVAMKEEEAASAAEEEQAPSAASQGEEDSEKQPPAADKQSVTSEPEPVSTAEQEPNAVGEQDLLIPTAAAEASAGPPSTQVASDDPYAMLSGLLDGTVAPASQTDQVQVVAEEHGGDDQDAAATAGGSAQACAPTTADDDPFAALSGMLEDV
eukprot:COSAG03_NODE_250_length_9949_cov_12.982538_4_plen_1117_part_00